MSSKTHGHDLSCTSSLSSSSPESQTQLLFLILCSCLFIASLLFSLPLEHLNGNLVPALIIFKAHPFLFHALMIAVMLSFAGASGACLIGNKVRLATVRSFYSVMSFVSISSASSILACALFLEIFRRVSSGIFKLRHLNGDQQILFNLTAMYFRYSERWILLLKKIDKIQSFFSCRVD